MNTPRFDGFYFNGHYFEAAWDDNHITWPCHEGCDGRLDVPMARLWSQKIGTIKLQCPSCHCPWQMEITSLNQPICADILELSTQPVNTSFFSSGTQL